MHGYPPWERIRPIRISFDRLVCTKDDYIIAYTINLNDIMVFSSPMIYWDEKRCINLELENLQTDSVPPRSRESTCSSFHPNIELVGRYKNDHAVRQDSGFQFCTIQEKKKEGGRAERSGVPRSNKFSVVRCWTLAIIFPLLRSRLITARLIAVL